MERVALIARLKPGMADQARNLIEIGPPFDLSESEFGRHNIFLSPGEVAFVFEARQVEWLVDDLLAEGFYRHRLAAALDAWRPLIEGEPRFAREEFSWERDGTPAVMTR